MHLSHPTLSVGSACPDCSIINTKGTLQKDEPKVLIRLVGSPLITGTRYITPCLRCNVCNTRYHAPVPDEIKKAPKYDVSCATTLAIGRYSLGLPMHRMEKNQAMHGIPMKDSTQWDLIKGLYEVVAPVQKALIEQASNGDLILYDDTPGRILENKARGLTTHTTAFISIHENRKIHLFFTGQNHAGNNADAILAQRTTDNPSSR